MNALPDYVSAVWSLRARDNPHGIFNRLGTALPALIPCRPLIPLDLRVQAAHRDAGVQRGFASALALLGSADSPEDAKHIQQIVGPDVVRGLLLMDRQAIYDTVGVGYGGDLAEAIIDPRRDPLLYAGVFGHDGTPLPVWYADVAVPLEVRALPHSRVECDMPAIGDDGKLCHPTFLDAAAATRLCQSHLPGIVLPTNYVFDGVKQQWELSWTPTES